MARGQRREQVRHFHKPGFVRRDFPSTSFKAVKSDKTFFDFDYPLNTTTALNSRSGVKMFNNRPEKASGFGRTRVFRFSAPAETTRRPAYRLEEQDSAGWAAALQDMGDDSIRASKATKHLPRIEQVNSPSTSALPSPPLSATTTNSSTTVLTRATSVSSTGTKKRKAADDESAESQHIQKYRRVEQLICKHGNVMVNSNSADIDMCDCDDPLHSLSDE